MDRACALFVLSVVYALGAALLAPATLAMQAGVALFGGCAVAGWCWWRGSRAQGTVGAALAVALQAAVAAAIFWGAEGALDTLNGAHRAKVDVSALLGGLELWFVLCPGVVAVALATAVQRALCHPEDVR